MRIFASARVAVLDTDADRRAALCKELSALGMLQMLPAATVEEARSLAKGAPVDLCIVDASGFVRRDAELGIGGCPPNPFDPARTPGILIAADATRQTVKAAMAAGYRIVIPAPVVPRIVYRRIGSILQKVRRAGRIQSPELAPSTLVAAAEVYPD
jgi:DNA-binding response OmpR family regulator